jgi:hemerythrin-like domain-containing protein
MQVLWYLNTEIGAAMNLLRQVSRTLDEEHRASLALLGRIESALARAPRPDPALTGLIGEFARALDGEIGRHFKFEEDALFPRMVESGDGDLAGLLAEEHAAIREVAAELLPLAHAATRSTLDEAGWAALRRCTQEIVERLVGHIEKEQAALVPLVDDLLDDDADRELAFGYAGA